jgi:chromosome segregation ATPase
MPTRHGLRDMLLASMDLLLEDHFVTLESNHQAQTRRISHLERSTQDSGLALIQAQADYAALEATVLEDRKKSESLEKELEKERSLRQAQAKDATSLISQLEKQLHSQTRSTSSLENRITNLTASLRESQNEIDRLESEMTKGYSEMNGRLSNIGRLEKEAVDWKNKAEEAEFTVRALREEGVRMSRELEKTGKIIEELEKGRKFVTRV